MIGQMKILLHVKTLKQEQAFRHLQSCRRALYEAEHAHHAAVKAVEESQRTLPARENAIFETIFGRTVALGEIDEIKARVATLHAKHQILVDERERTAHVEARVRRERDEAADAFRKATKVTDKYDVITQDLVTAQAEALTAREEGETEDMFSRSRRKIA
ncbi:type III secretion system stalk subunit SctO [Rhizobium oryzicola]|uniref:YscO family type III secretion system apparatus protein n=1 Tax=Rhizobium oryzicola TaxID=1232668 RepID=A0ABT8SXJ5_9HYPH|nr:YscO family type III secretion system apparatus protein [Rhizobium oryzicola]MDO1583185.1 YscO family type III secretion system apparatus protein [Rhizobium oryzicola]